MKDQIKKSSARRLGIILGQVRGLRKMVEEEKYCVDIIRQSLAIREALSSLDNLILESHLTSHVIRQIKGKESKKAVRELLEIYKSSKKI